MIDKLSWISAYPEIILLVMACVIAIADLNVKDPRRTPTYILTLLTLTLVAALPMLSSSSAAYPKGCYLYRSISKVYFNPHPTGAAHSTSTPICGPAPSAGAPRAVL